MVKKGGRGLVEMVEVAFEIVVGNDGRGGGRESLFGWRLRW